VPDTIKGLGVSAGVAAGPALRMGRPPSLPAARTVTDPPAERRQALEALALLGDELDERAGRAADPAAAAILEAQAMIARDPMLGDGIDAEIGYGHDAAHAVHRAFTTQADVLRAADDYLAERAADIEDLRDRAVARILGEPMPGIPDPGHPYILIADDLAPADTATLDPTLVLALVTARGGPTSHTAILARALGLPAVVGCAAALGIEDKTLIRVDGGDGTVQVGVSSDVVAEAAENTRSVRGPSATSGPGRTADGHLVPLMLNIGSVADLRSEAAEHAEGVGLFRTELLFLDRHDAPGLEEQRTVYTQVFQALAGKKVVVRTLDAGADKPLPFLGLAEEPNPALGVRGLRTSRLRPDILDLQLRAISEAASQSEADVWVMAPMVSTVEEASEFADHVRSHGLRTAGVMIEVPAAALRARQILDHGGVSFLSIGTNDLGQYTMAADRQNGDLADLLDPWQPALLDLIAHCAEAGHEADKPVGVCGEAAADPLLAVVLVGLGVSSLSMSARAVAAVRDRLSQHTLQACRGAAMLALRADSAQGARKAVAAWAKPV
jgi:phosphoenolpyruvate-protein phosphotransferase (PTS system enzyme I)